MLPLPEMLAEEVHIGGEGPCAFTVLPPLHHSYGPLRAPYVFSRFPGVARATAFPYPPACTVGR